MKNLYFLKPLFVLLVSINIGVAISAQNFNLIDINKIKTSNPQNNQNSALNMFAELKGVFYFSADDGINGAELWSSDGTTGGTQLVKDINPGTPSADPANIMVSGGKLYFTAFDDKHNKQLWVSDGTAAGTKSLIDLVVTGLNIVPASTYLTDVNGSLYFINNYYNFNTFPYTYTQLWKSDGTKAGTIMIENLSAKFNTNDVSRDLVNVNGRLFFTLYNFGEIGTELYTSDGTSEGTTMVADINPNLYSSSYPTHLTALNGLLYFSADDGTGGKLWVSDGTTGGTHAVNNRHNIYVPVIPYIFEPSSPFEVRNNTLFFQGSTATSGYELCKYNASDIDNNVKLVKDIIPGESSSYPNYIMNVKGVLYFTITAANSAVELWKSDGSDEGTVLVKEINSGGNNVYYGLINAGGILMFANGNTLGTELWKSDGTPGGTVLVKDINFGAASSYPGYFTYKKGIFIFSADDGTKGRELWVSDGTEAGTTLVKNINQTSTSSSYPNGFTAAKNNKVIFNAYDGTNYGLFATDGSEAGTKQISFTNLNYHVNFKNKTYFLDYSNKLWKTNGTKAGTSMLPITAIPDGQSGYVTNMVATETSIYFVIYDFATNTNNLWRTDGTTAGTYFLHSDIYDFPTPVGNTLFFGTFKDGGGQLWKTDGTLNGTALVKEVSTPFTYTPVFKLNNFKGKLYFVAQNVSPQTGNFYYTLWTSDGTETGTNIFKAVSIDFSSQFAQANGKMFFYALNPLTKGYELFATDGTTGGTRLVKDINKGFGSSSVNSLVSGDTLLYFMADDGRHGLELWKSNGTKEGTSLVKNITPGVNSSMINQRVNINNKLFFTINDTLWQSDGTKEGTYTVKDESLKGVTQISYLTAIGDSLYFSGYTHAAGQEVYIGNATALFNNMRTITASALVTEKKDDAFTAKLLTNPVVDNLKFSVNVKNQQPAQVIIADAAGRVLTYSKHDLSAGTNMFSYDTKAWTQGMYLIRVIARDGSYLLKAVK